MVKKDKFIN